MGHRLMTDTGTGTRHKADCKRVWKRYDPSCARCTELAGGAKAREGWGSFRREQEALVALHTTRTIYLPAIDRHVSLAAYVGAVKLAKGSPAATFKTGFTTWWPTTGAEIMCQFRRGMTERINQAIPYTQRGITTIKKKGKS
jgi:hypothetical protein